MECHIQAHLAEGVEVECQFPRHQEQGLRHVALQEREASHYSSEQWSLTHSAHILGVLDRFKGRASALSLLGGSDGGVPASRDDTCSSVVHTQHQCFHPRCQSTHVHRRTHTHPHMHTLN